MKWIWKKEPEFCDTRVKKWFAILPVTINNECRWLETVTVMQRYIIGWSNVEFIDDTIQNNSSKQT